MKKIKISDRLVGEEEPCFIIAEAGLNHGGDFKIAKEMVKVAADAGADAVTFQHILGDKFFAGIKKESSTNDWNKWQLSERELKELFEYASELNLLYTACVIDNESIDKIIEYGVSFFKIVSGDLTNLPFLEYCATKKLPILLSTGAAGLSEVEIALNTIQSVGNQDIVVYHTNSGYPTPPEGVNLRVMDTLKGAFGLPVGFCDHTLEIITPVVAVARGANVIEKHFTLDRSLKGPDYEVSLEPRELKEMVTNIRLCQKMLGSFIKKPLEYEQRTLEFARRSVVAGVKICKGTIITKGMLTFKRPGTGITPSLANLVVGRSAKVDIDEDEIITWDMI
ncbi:MAG: N-acetylneuraminate synthase family protein [Candidatus Omnitrophica bacterium]|nr:N-acetylneuraminate synthase family protein [Candidatus Omnitrophota bacterium]